MACCPCVPDPIPVALNSSCRIHFHRLTSAVRKLSLPVAMLLGGRFRAPLTTSSGGSSSIQGPAVKSCIAFRSNCTFAVGSTAAPTTFNIQFVLRPHHVSHFCVSLWLRVLQFLHAAIAAPHGASHTLASTTQSQVGSLALLHASSVTLPPISAWATPLLIELHRYATPCPIFRRDTCSFPTNCSSAASHSS